MSRKLIWLQLLKPGEYPAIVLYLVDEAFHQLPLSVEASIAGLGVPVWLAEAV